MAYLRARFMARKLCIQYPGAIYHAMNCSHHQVRIFCDDADRKMFLTTLAEGCDETGWQVHSYCLMTNPRMRPASAPSVLRPWLRP